MPDHDGPTLGTTGCKLFERHIFHICPSCLTSNMLVTVGGSLDWVIFNTRGSTIALHIQISCIPCREGGRGALPLRHVKRHLGPLISRLPLHCHITDHLGQQEPGKMMHALSFTAFSLNVWNQSRPVNNPHSPQPLPFFKIGQPAKQESMQQCSFRTRYLICSLWPQRAFSCELSAGALRVPYSLWSVKSSWSIEACLWI